MTTTAGTTHDPPAGGAPDVSCSAMDLGHLTLTRLRPWHHVLAHCLAMRLDRQLAAGTSPETSALLAARALQLISPKYRRELAAGLHEILTAAAHRSTQSAVPLAKAAVTVMRPAQQARRAAVPGQYVIAAGGPRAIPAYTKLGEAEAALTWPGWTVEPLCVAARHGYRLDPLPASPLLILPLLGQLIQDEPRWWYPSRDPRRWPCAPLRSPHKRSRPPSATSRPRLPSGGADLFNS